jgi:hypothetical protein
MPIEFSGNGAGNYLGKEYDTAGIPHEDSLEVNIFLFI